MNKTINIATNSVRMLYNYRKPLLNDLCRMGKLKYYLSSNPDCGLLLNEEHDVFSTSSQSFKFHKSISDLYNVFIKLHKSSGPWLVFTARNILIFGFAAFLSRKKLNVAYFAGLGKGISAKSLQNSFIYKFIFRLLLSSYDVVFCLNDRDNSLLNKVHNNVIFIKGEGYDLSDAALKMQIKNDGFDFDYGFVGRFSKEKGADDFLSIASLSSNKKFIIYGEVDSDYLECIESLHNVDIAGFVDNKNAIYTSFKTLLHLSTLNEGLPFVFFECIKFCKKIIILENPTTNTIVKYFGGRVMPFEALKNKNLDHYDTLLSIGADKIDEFSYEYTNKKVLQWM